MYYLFFFVFFFSSRRRHTRFDCDWSSDVCSSDLVAGEVDAVQISAPAIVPVVLAGGNITMIAGLLNKMIFFFHAQKEVNAAEQLRGNMGGGGRTGWARE